MSPHYWQQAGAELAARDPVMAKLVVAHSGLSLQSRGDAFATLARSIVGQQISVKAADSVWARTLARVESITPQAFLATAADELAACGLSRRKVEYLQDLSRHFTQGNMHTLAWNEMDDETIIAELVAVRGIGQWTAEMFLIFNLMRPDVLPVDDIGLLRAIGLHYFDGIQPKPAQVRQLGETWRPWRSVATWYLWRSLDPVPVEY